MPVLNQTGLQDAGGLGVPPHHDAAADPPVTAALRVFLLEAFGQNPCSGDVVEVTKIFLEGFEPLQIPFQSLAGIQVLEELHGVAQFLQFLANLVTLLVSKVFEAVTPFADSAMAFAEKLAREIGHRPE